MKGPRFQVKQGDDGLWYYHLRAANGRIVMDGAEGYATKAGAERALGRVANITDYATYTYYKTRHQMD